LPVRSASRHQLIVPRHHCSTFSCRHWAFSIAGPMAWNNLPMVIQLPVPAVSRKH